MNPYILWVDYGCYEGWANEEFATLAELGAAIEAGRTFGHPFLITQRLSLDIRPLEDRCPRCGAHPTSVPCILADPPEQFEAPLQEVLESLYNKQQLQPKENK